MTIDCLYLAYMFWSDCLASKAHKAFILYFHGTHIAYIALKISTMADMSSHTRQQVVGLVMFCLLLQLVVAEVVICACLLIYSLFSFVKKCSASRRQV